MPACELCGGFSWSKDMRVDDKGRACCKHCSYQDDKYKPTNFFGFYISDKEIDFAIGLGRLSVEYKDSMSNFKSAFKKKPKELEEKDGLDMRDIRIAAGAVQNLSET